MEWHFSRNRNQVEKKTEKKEKKIYQRGIRHANMDKSILNIYKNIFWHPTYVNFF